MQMLINVTDENDRKTTVQALRKTIEFLEKLNNDSNVTYTDLDGKIYNVKLIYLPRLIEAPEVYKVVE